MEQKMRVQARTPDKLKQGDVCWLVVDGEWMVVKVVFIMKQLLVPGWVSISTIDEHSLPMVIPARKDQTVYIVTDERLKK